MLEIYATHFLATTRLSVYGMTISLSLIFIDNVSEADPHHNSNLCPEKKLLLIKNEFSFTPVAFFL